MFDVDPQHLALAHYHVRRSREIVAEQRALIELIRIAGGPFNREENLFSTFEDTLVIFEEDLGSLLVRAAMDRAALRQG